MLAPIVLYQEIYYALYLLFDMLYLCIHHFTLTCVHVLQLLEQLPHVHVPDLQFLPEFENSECVVVEC